MRKTKAESEIERIYRGGRKPTEAELDNVRSLIYSDFEKRHGRSPTLDEFEKEIGLSGLTGTRAQQVYAVAGTWRARRTPAAQFAMSRTDPEISAASVLSLLFWRLAVAFWSVQSTSTSSKLPGARARPRAPQQGQQPKRVLELASTSPLRASRASKKKPAHSAG